MTQLHRCIAISATIFSLHTMALAEDESADVVVLTSVQDTYVEQGNGRDDNNNGASNFAAKVKSFRDTDFESVMLIRFDLSQEPADEVESATLRLWVPINPLAEHTKHATFGVYGMNDDWLEGTGTGTIGEATGDGATWKTRDGSAPWTGDRFATGLQSNGSFDAQPTATKEHPGEWGAWSGSWVEFDVTPLVNAWLTSGRENHGLAVTGHSRSREDGSVFMMFATREYNKEKATPGEKAPQLVIRRPAGHEDEE